MKLRYGEAAPCAHIIGKKYLLICSNKRRKEDWLQPLSRRLVMNAMRSNTQKQFLQANWEAKFK
jgi:hypothetical protein